MKTAQTTLSASIVAVGALFVLGCKTTQSYKRVDTKANNITLISTNDKRSALGDPQSDSDVIRAKRNLNSTLKDTPERTVSWLNLANLELASGNLAAAEEACRQAVRTDIKNKTCKKIVAAIALRKGQVDLAELLLNDFGPAGASDGTVLNLRAIIALKRKDPTTAVSILKKALELEPGNLSARLNLGAIYIRYRQFRGAAIQYERVLKMMPENTDAKLHLAILRTVSGNYQEANVLLRQVLDDQRNNPLALFNIAVVYKNMENYEEALDNLKAYLQQVRDNASDSKQAIALVEEIRDLANAKNQPLASDDELVRIAEDTSPKTSVQAPTAQPAPATSSSGEVEDLEKELLK